jgi:hypothetical protein
VCSGAGRAWYWRFDAPLSAVRLGIAIVLFAAALLKTHQLATEPILGTGLLDSRLLLVLVVQIELLLAFWLASGLLRAASWRVAMGTFAVFAVVAAGKGIAGDSLCGCFGRVPTSPWFSFWLDVSVVGALCTSRPAALRGSGSVAAPRARVAAEGWQALQNLWSAPERPATACLITGWLLAAPMLGIAGFRGAQIDDLAAIGRRVGDFIIVEPERMAGEPFHLGRHIDIGDRLARGRWLVFLYQVGCPECERLFLQTREAFAEPLIDVEIAVVQVPSHSPTALGKAKVDGLPFVHGRLDDKVEWFVRTPLLLIVQDNRVLGVAATLDQAQRRL